MKPILTRAEAIDLMHNKAARSAWIEAIQPYYGNASRPWASAYRPCSDDITVLFDHIDAGSLLATETLTTFYGKFIANTLNGD